MERRKFIRYVGTLGAASLLLPDLLASCSSSKKGITTKILGANSDRGHLIRDHYVRFQQKPSQIIKCGVAIAGGGVSGLSAAYHLKKAGVTDFQLFELNDAIGGNSGYDSNQYSRFPLGAHYLSLANSDNVELIAFLKEQGLITGEENGKMIYDELQLCHAPDERLLYRGVFQEGLVPEYGISEETRAEITRFFKEMRALKNAKDTNGVQLYSIPLSKSSHINHLEKLDNITFAEYLRSKGYKSEELLWFLDYCCRDDFGAGMHKVSAWAGIHYFAARKAEPANTDPTTVLTWPEGNAFLVNKLAENTRSHIHQNTLVFEVTEHPGYVEVKTMNCKTLEIIHYHAEKCIFSSPSYVAKHVLKSDCWPTEFFNGFKHQPWLIGIVVLNKFPESNGTPLAWDNVKFGTKGLGYVSDRNQELKRVIDKHVISVYLALDREDDNIARQKLFNYTEEEMKAMVLEELKSMHPLIEEDVVSISFQRWGHGMITPYPGALHKYNDYLELKKKAKRVHLAHTDYSSYSVFEEGFDVGLQAAKNCTI